MELTRRGFLKISGASTAGLLLFKGSGWKKVLGFSPIPLRKDLVNETYTICCYCAVGCGALVVTEAGNIVNIEGNPDHPINEGTLCSKGQALSQFRTVDGKDNLRRLTKPLYRAPGATEWEEVDWDWAIDQVAKKIKKTRDENWLSTVDVGGTTYPVNRTDAIAHFGGGELDNEECYLLVKMTRALGMVYIEHCARI
jgi:formate dehydrogenase major subunit